MQFDAHGLRTRMADDISQCFLSDSEAGRLDWPAEALQRPVSKKVDPKTNALRLLIDVPLQRRHQPQVIQQRRTKVERQLPHLLQESFKDGEALV